MEKMLLIDIDRCIRCFACEVACKQENDLPVGYRWNSVVTIEPRRINEELVSDFVFTTCMQCEDPNCALACPEEAITKRKDGIIIIDETLCKGCGQCVHACPFGAIQINPEKKKAWKCSMCIQRLEQDKEPSCVQHCAGGSLQYVTSDELKKATKGRHQAVIGKVCYTSTRWKLNIG
jgi:Fe-S-cluster-containing dehydrogenase component